MFADYKSLVVQDYKEKRKLNTLPPALVRPSPAKLRAVCMMICEERFNIKDLPTLRTFFGVCNDKASCLEAIDRFNTGKFKALGNFLEGKTSTPDDKIVELLAWLIDFTPRPHEFGRVYSIDIQASDEVEPVTIHQVESEPALPPPPQEVVAMEPAQVAPRTPLIYKAATPIGKKRAIILAAFTAAICFAGIYLWLNGKAPGSNACMFWTGDHYQPVGCNEASENVLVRQLDSVKIARFRKITRPDTITEAALGSIWCVRYNNVYECYTDTGWHPIDTTLRLQILTDYILIRYIHPGLQPTATLSR